MYIYMIFLAKEGLHTPRPPSEQPVINTVFIDVEDQKKSIGVLTGNIAFNSQINETEKEHRHLENDL